MPPSKNRRSGDVNLESSRARHAIAICKRGFDAPSGLKVRFSSLSDARKARTYFYSIRRALEYRRGVGFDEVLDVSLALEQDEKGWFLLVKNGDFGKEILSIEDASTGESVDVEEAASEVASIAASVGTSLQREISKDEIETIKIAREKWLAKGASEEEADLLAQLVAGIIDMDAPGVTAAYNKYKDRPEDHRRVS